MEAATPPVWNRRILLIVMLALGLRLAALGLVAPSPPVYDERDYLNRASRIVEGDPVGREAARPPGTIWYYAGFLKAFGDRPEVARVANLIASTLLVWLTWLVGFRAGGGRVAWIAALGAAVYPDLIFYGVALWAEPLYGVLWLGALAVALSAARAGETPRFRAAPLAVAGVLFGLATLTRDVGALAAAATGFWLAGRLGWRTPRAWAALSVVGLACVITVLPWTVRQSRAHGYFVFVTNSNWLNLYIGNMAPEDLGRSPRADGRPLMTPYYPELRALAENVDDRIAIAKPRVKKRIAERMPWWPVEKTAEMMPRILQPNSLPTARLMARPRGGGWSGRYAYRTTVDGTPREFLRDWTASLNIAMWCLLAVGGTAGLVLTRRRPEMGLLALVIVAHLLPPIVGFGQSRYRIPIVPVLFIGLAFLAVHLRPAWREAGPIRRGIALALPALVAWTVASFWWTVETPQWG